MPIIQIKYHAYNKLYQKYLIVASLTIITINAFKTLIYFVHQKS